MFFAQLVFNLSVQMDVSTTRPWARTLTHVPHSSKEHCGPAWQLCFCIMPFSHVVECSFSFLISFCLLCFPIGGTNERFWPRNKSSSTLPGEVRAFFPISHFRPGAWDVSLQPQLVSTTDNVSWAISFEVFTFLCSIFAQPWDFKSFKRVFCWAASGIPGRNVLSRLNFRSLKSFLFFVLWDFLEFIITLEFGSCSFSGLHWSC